MHDPLDPYDLVLDELDQRRETGHDVGSAADAFARLAHDDRDGLEALYQELIEAPRLPGWEYEEPDALGDILDSLPAPSADRSPRDLPDQVLGGWLGRIAGCNVGKPVEWGPHWTVEHIRDYLERAGEYPLRDYFPVLDPMPPGFDLRDNWPQTTKGNVDGAARDDDVDYAILGLHLLEQRGRDLTTGDIAEAWLDLLPYYQVYTAERAAYTNLVRSVPMDAVASTRNPYREWIGALIRGDAFGWTNPGRPRDALTLAHRDASLSHVANGIYGELWSAALVSGAFGAGSVAEAFEASLEHVPPRSRLAEALRDVQGWRADGLSWDAALEHIRERYGAYSWVHTINNACLIAAGLLWGEDDLAQTIGLTVMGGWDTDSNGATAGSVAGVVLGASALPPHLIEPLHDTTRSALFGYDHSRISDLASRTVVVAERIRP